MDAGRQFRDLRPAPLRDLRHVLVLHRDEQDVLVQHLVVLQVVQQRGRHVIRVAGHEHRQARHADDPRLRQPGQERRERHAGLLPARQQQVAPAFPRRHHAGQREAQHQRHPAALDDLHRVGGEEHRRPPGTARRTPITAAARDQWNCRRNTTIARTAVHRNVPVTAMP